MAPATLLPADRMMPFVIPFKGGPGKAAGGAPSLARSHGALTYYANIVHSYCRKFYCKYLLVELCGVVWEILVTECFLGTSTRFFLIQHFDETKV